MIDFLAENGIYIVMIIVLVVWIGVFSYQFSLDRRVKKLENEVEAIEHEE